MNQMKKEYEEIHGRKYAILWRKKGNELTDECPFCGSKHIHGTSEGHRVAHCADSVDEKGNICYVSGFYAKDGTYFAPKKGYVIREY
jgi:hypothetical protein